MNKGFLDWFHSASADVVCLQEIKAYPEQVDPAAVQVDGFHTVFNPAKKPGYSGVAVYSKPPPRSVHLGMGIERFDSEGRIIRLEFDEFDLLNVYFPNGTSGDDRLKFKLEFYDAFLDHCQALRAQGKKLVITGDVNTAHKPIDLKNPKANEKNSGFLPEERAWIDTLFTHGYVDTFRLLHPDEPEQYTWWSYRFNARSKNIGWRIDYFFVTEDLVPRIKDSFISPEVMGSDHCPIGLEIKAG